MSLDNVSPESSRGVAAVVVIFVLWGMYTLLQTLFVVGRISEAWSAALGFVPGLVGVFALLSSGMSREEIFLVVKPVSRKGFAVLAAVFVFALAAILPFSVWEGWSWKAALIMAPSGGIAQELFFRSSLLPALQRFLSERNCGALVLHSALFGLWHIGPLFVGAPIWAVIAVMFVPFISGLGWGWQVSRDGTVLWAMAQHSLIWVIGLQFSVVG